MQTFRPQPPRVALQAISAAPGAPCAAVRLWPRLILLGALLMAALTAPAHAAPIADYDFSQGLQGWIGGPQVSSLTTSTEGLTITSTGGDPWIEGPTADYPTTQPVRLRFRIKTALSPAAAIYYGPGFVQARSVELPIASDGQWHEYAITLPPLGPGARLRLDPAGMAGSLQIGWIKAETWQEMETQVNHDFSAGLLGWSAASGITGLATSSNGLAFTVNGVAPRLLGPSLTWPSDRQIRVTLRMASTAPDGQAALYWGPSLVEANRVDFAVVNDGGIRTYEVLLPVIGPSGRLWLRPCASATGSVIVTGLWADAPLQSSDVRVIDFTAGTQGWTPLNHIANFQSTAAGLSFNTTSFDPYMISPLLSYPAGQRLLVTIRLRSTADGNGQLFHGATISEANSTRFSFIADGQFHDTTLIIPPIGPSAYLRLDPGSSPGAVTIESIRMRTFFERTAPHYDVPRRPAAGGGAARTVSSGALTLRHEGQVWDGFTIGQGGTEMAAAHTAGQLGYQRPSGFPAWLQMGSLPVTLTALGGGGLRAESTLTDPDGAQWSLRRDFAPLPLTGTIAVTTTLSVNQSRALIHFPWLTLLPGLETYGTQKEQGLVAGIEYLEDEPSSSEADVRGPGAIRRVPDPVKFTFPLMAILRGGNYLGLSWTQGPHVAALFDSPDRILPSGAQLMGLHAPNVGTERLENAPVAHGTITLAAGVPLVSASAILAGGGVATVVPAIEHYVALRGLPPLPSYAPGFEGAARMLGRGWLDSAITTNGLVHHALPGSGFPATRAAEPGVHLRWLANQVSDQALATRMRDRSVQIIARTQEINPGTGQPYDTIYSSSVSHVQLPIGAMLFGNLPQYVAQHLGQAAAFVSAFDADGLIHYVPAQDRPDFGVTHFATHANGQSSNQLQWIMNSVALSGDLTLTAQALDLLDKNWVAYGNSIPRGGQTWEVPLHTPDIIVAGHLCNANLMAYQLSREQKYLDRARYWAWTGVPFVYLAPPTSNPIGLYATIPVLGATWWGENGAPNWIGLPVQWCGMVYAHALYRLAEIDTAGPWLQLARGMSFSGLQQSWPEDSHPDYMGTLPDSFVLQTQTRNVAMINPGTMTADLPRAFGTGAMYAQVTTPQWRWQLHAPAKITAWEEFATGVRFTIAGGWGSDSFRALVSNLPSAPLQVSRRAAGSTAPFVAAPHSFSASTRQLELQNITGATEFEIVMPFSHGVWGFDRPADFAGWQAAHDLTGGIISGGRMSLTLSGCDPFLYGPVVAFDAAQYRYIRVRMRNQTAASSGSLFWTTQRLTGFSPGREVGFALVPNDAQTRDYVIDMQGRAGWEGTITQLRLDAVAGACSGRIEIDSIEVLKTLTPRSEVGDWQVFQ